MSDIIDLTDWLKSQPETFSTKKRLLVFTDIIHTPSGEKVVEGFRYFAADSAALLAAFDADDLAAITALEYAVDEDGDVDTSAVLIKLAYTQGGAFLAAQPEEYVDYVPTNLREPKYLTVPASLAGRIAEIDQSS